MSISNPVMAVKGTFKPHRRRLRALFHYARNQSQALINSVSVGTLRNLSHCTHYFFQLDGRRLWRGGKGKPRTDTDCAVWRQGARA